MAFVAAAALLLLLASLPVAGVAGTTGVVNGTVYDCAFPCASPMPRIPFATVEVLGLAANSRYVMSSTTAGKDGSFAFVALEPGTYAIIARKNGFAIGCIAIARVDADQVTSVFVSVSTKRWLGHCYQRRSPTPTLSTWTLDSRGNLEQ